MVYQLYLNLFRDLCFKQHALINLTLILIQSVSVIVTFFICKKWGECIQYVTIPMYI